MSTGNIYRGKRTDNNKWAIGYYVFDECDIIAENLKCRVRGTAELINAYPVESKTVCRSVGKKDKCETMIFEGDVLAYLNTWRFIVRYGEFNGTVGLGYYYGLGFYLERIGDPTHKVPFNAIDCDEQRYEIIGNVFDNPELMKGDGLIE